MRQLFVVCWCAIALTMMMVPIEMSDVRFVSAKRYFDQKYISNMTTFIGNEPNSLNLEITLLQPILDDFYATIDVQIRLKDSKRYQSLFVENFDVCELVNNVFIDNLMKKWFKNMLKYGNFMENCPVPEGHYYLRELVVEQTSIPMYLRPGDYRIVLSGYYKKLNQTMVGGTIDILWIK